MLIHPSYMSWIRCRTNCFYRRRLFTTVINSSVKVFSFLPSKHNGLISKFEIAKHFLQYRECDFDMWNGEFVAGKIESGFLVNRESRNYFIALLLSSIGNNLVRRVPCWFSWFIVQPQRNTSVRLFVCWIQPIGNSEQNKRKLLQQMCVFMFVGLSVHTHTRVHGRSDY